MLQEAQTIWSRCANAGVTHVLTATLASHEFKTWCQPTRPRAGVPHLEAKVVIIKVTVIADLAVQSLSILCRARLGGRQRRQLSGKDQA